METWWDLNSPYRYRNDNLERMGFRTFRAYLKSDLWKSIRVRVLEWSPLCQSCFKKKATQVHHRSYDPATLKGDELRSLTALCARCHRLAERPDEKQAAYDRLQNANKRITRAR